MKTLTIKAHSVVDVITNSSTVIYTQARKGSINTLKDIINSILAIAESKLKAEDIFDFEITSEDLDEQRMDLLGDRGDLEEYVGRDIQWKDPEYNVKKDELFNKIVAGEIDKPDWWEYGYSSEGEGHQCDTTIKVTCKTDNEFCKIAADLLSQLDTLFHSMEGYN